MQTPRSMAFARLRIAALASCLMWVVTASWAGGSYAKCLLDRLTGSTNEALTNAAVGICLRDYPGGYTTVKKGSGRSLFFNTSSDACILEKAKGVMNNRASFLIAGACKCLYDTPGRKDELCQTATPNAFDNLPIEPAPQATKPDQVQVDLETAATQAVIDYPFLDTPEGAEALRKIMERRDALIHQGTYPATALRQAVATVAPGYAAQLKKK